MSTTTNLAMNVWGGCSHCCSHSRLVGEWHDAIDADKASLADVHRSSDGSRIECEELWCFDADDIRSAVWDRVVEKVDGHLGP